MKTKEIEGQLSLFDLQQSKDEVDGSVSAKASVKDSSNSDSLNIGDIIWSCYGNYENGRDTKAYVITAITAKGYTAVEADSEQKKNRFSLTLKSEGIAWARTREDAEKIKSYST
mgnify:CR=1 FL=1